MLKKLLFLLLFSGFSGGYLAAQTFISTEDLFYRPESNSHIGRLRIYQDPAIDTLIGRYILAKKYQSYNLGYYGMDGWRIQIYASSNRNAREESAKVRAEFMNRFPDIVSYQLYADPGWFKVRVGDFRSKTEAARLFLAISREFPDSYILPDIINFPDQIKK
jgi:hypothetical protein